jgi:hypothetical protein
MSHQTAAPLSELYEADETAWLEAMADLISRGKTDELDFDHLREFLSEMATRDRREVKSRMVVLIMHLLKWRCQPTRRNASWRVTIQLQASELGDIASTGVLRNHAEAILEGVYERAAKLAADETELPRSAFPKECPFTLEDLFKAADLAE